MRTVAVVPARAGSKGLPGKNLRPLAGQPLLLHTIRAGLEASSVDAVYVSTEDGETASVAAAAGAEVIHRPAELATDTAQNDAVVRHALAEIRGAGDDPEVVVLLQPTSPLRTARHVDACLEAFMASGAASCMSVCEAEHHPGKAVTLQDGLAEPFTTEADMEARRQDMTPAYRQNGAIYVVGVADFLAHGRFYLRPCLAYAMDRRVSIDIDDALDLRLAELLVQEPANG